MCEEIRAAWKRVKDDPNVNAVVLRAAGDRAFSAGLDTKKSYGQPDDIWNHEDPGELLSPKWQKVWKPVVCAVQGICTAGAFYFLNEADIVICSTDATFFDSHVTYGLVCALEPIGLMRKVGLAETLRIALMGNDERVTADTALRIGLVTEVVDRGRALGPGARDRRRPSRRKPSSATQGTVRAIWESLDRPYRAAMEQGLIYTRLGNPIGQAAIAENPPEKKPPRLEMSSLSARIAQVLAIDPTANAIEFEGDGHVGRARRHRRRAAKLVEQPGTEVGILMREHARKRSASCSACSEPAAASSPINPEPQRDRIQARPRRHARVRHPRAVAGPACSPAVRPVRRSGSTSPTTPSNASSSAPSTTGRPHQTSTELRRGVGDRERAARPSRRALPGAAVRHRRPLVRACSTGSPSTSWVDAVRRHRPATASLVPGRAAHGARGRPSPEDLSSLRSVICGTAPLDPDDADAFLDEYGVPVLINYAATEFGGGVAGWNLEDLKSFWATKRGSAGRAHAGSELRVSVDRPARSEGRAARWRRSWVRTTDLARIDEDGFLWILGRADQAINRGGFKVLPEDVKAALERHSAVRSARRRRPGRSPPRCRARRRRRAAAGRRAGQLRRPARPRSDAPRPLRAAHRDPHRRGAAPHATPARSTSSPSARCSKRS